MRGTWIVFRREVGQYFVSPVAYLIAAAFLFLTGFLFNNDLIASVTVKSASPAVVPAFLSFALVFFAPVLTMRMLAEETREGTLELLLTAPVNDTDIVIGKFLGAWFYYTLLLIITLVYQMILRRPSPSPTSAMRSAPTWASGCMAARLWRWACFSRPSPRIRWWLPFSALPPCWCSIWVGWPGRSSPISTSRASSIS